MDNDDGTISFSGIIKSANDINFTVQRGEKMMTVVYDQVKKANLILEFNLYSFDGLKVIFLPLSLLTVFFFLITLTIHL